MAAFGNPTKEDLVEDVMERLRQLSSADENDGVRLSRIRDGLKRFRMEELDALWWMLDPDMRRP